MKGLGVKTMVVHIFPYKLYTKGFIDFTREKYDMDEHTFIVYGKCPNENFAVKEEQGVLFTDLPSDIVRDKEFYRLTENAQQIIVHSNNVLVTKMFLKKRSWLKKAYIVFWGYDLYCYRDSAKGINQKLWRVIQLWQIRNAKAVCVLADKEKQVMDELIPGIKGKKMRAMYMISSENAKMQALINYKKSIEPYKIIVGNSSSETNCHEDILKRLSKYAEQNILVYCPLSYGSDVYRNMVINLGKKLFGEKFVPLTALMPYEEYYRFTNDCTIGLFNNDRQQAMGNILMMLEQGAKVYLRSDTPMWDLFKKQGYIFYNIDDVGELRWEEFVDFSDDKKKTNTQIYLKGNSLDAAKKIWDIIFEDGLQRR